MLGLLYATSAGYNPPDSGLSSNARSLPLFFLASRSRACSFCLYQPPGPGIINILFSWMETLIDWPGQKPASCSHLPPSLISGRPGPDLLPPINFPCTRRIRIFFEGWFLIPRDFLTAFDTGWDKSPGSGPVSECDGVGSIRYKPYKLLIYCLTSNISKSTTALDRFPSVFHQSDTFFFPAFAVFSPRGGHKKSYRDGPVAFIEIGFINLD